MEMEHKKVEDRNNRETKALALKEYTEPEITKLGAMQKVTQGGTSGFGDSGDNVNVEQD